MERIFIFYGVEKWIEKLDLTQCSANIVSSSSSSKNNFEPLRQKLCTQTSALSRRITRSLFYIAFRHVSCLRSAGKGPSIYATTI